MNNITPEVSVIMPVYNSQDTLYCSINSVLNQTFSEFELIIVNDGSTDNSENIIMSFNDNRIKYFKIEHKGRSYASNYGILNSTTGFIARLDSDDMFFKDKLKLQMDFLRENPGIDILYSWSIFYGEHKMLRFWNSPQYDSQIKSKLIYLNPINHSSVIFNKYSVAKYSFYDENIEINEDYDLWIRCSKDLVFNCLQKYLVFSKIKSDIYKNKFNNNLVSMLKENAINKQILSHKELNDVLGRIEYFFGKTYNARRALLNGNIFRNLMLVLFTFIPDVILKHFRGKKLILLPGLNILKVHYYKKVLKNLLDK